MYLSEDFSGQHTVLDTRDANDPDYVPESRKNPNMNVSTHLNIRLGMLASELEIGGGMESKASNFTMLLGVSYQEGYNYINDKIVISRSKLESAFKRDGEKNLRTSLQKSCRFVCFIFPLWYSTVDKD